MFFLMFLLVEIGNWWWSGDWTSHWFSYYLRMLNLMVVGSGVYVRGLYM